ncbi:energy-coupling factor ABC transporter ATP-binding protein, partial [bacterium]|nr:energy-coupling factor ABC transporter ATP-binding protein [bacterium]
DIIAIIGANGSGKTTLLQCLANLNPNYQGSLAVYGSSPTKKNWEWAKQAIYCFQNPDDQLYKATVLDGIKTTLSALKRTIPENLAEELETFGLSDYLNCEPYHLARPIRRMVCFAATMLSESPVVLLDEPTANLDKRFKDIILKKIQDPGKKCAVVIIISHDHDFVSQSANKIIEMENGLIKYYPKQQDNNKFNQSKILNSNVFKTSNH